MSVQSATRAGRVAAERAMLDVGTAKRPTGGYTFDPDTDTELEAVSDLFTSPCKVQSRNVQPREAEVGERTSVSVRTELHLPVSTDPLTAGDLFVVTTPHALSTVAADTTFRVVAPVGKTLATARRYEVVEIVT